MKEKVPKIISWFKDEANMLEIKVLIDDVIYTYSVPNSPKIQSVERQWRKGIFGFKQLNTIKELKVDLEREIVRPE